MVAASGLGQSSGSAEREVGPTFQRQVPCGDQTVVQLAVPPGASGGDSLTEVVTQWTILRDGSAGSPKSSLFFLMVSYPRKSMEHHFAW